MFRFYYNNLAASASRGVAVAALMFGLLMAGFGALIAAFPKVFAFLAAAVFFVVGLACVLFSIRMFIAGAQARKRARSQSNIIDVDPM
ncbi:MAG: hypothetical protein A2Y07_10285 [Planctomycetes bacterium GWF2_50_10]|nr:MAG: hypothetical protein A2Y07_10285 [Planctomycetes bacterium GWF2_50_10]